MRIAQVGHKEANKRNETMTKHFYAVDHADKDQPILAFTEKKARDNFVDGGNRRFAKTRAECDEICLNRFECNAGEAVSRGFI